MTLKSPQTLVSDKSTVLENILVKQQKEREEREMLQSNMLSGAGSGRDDRVNARPKAFKQGDIQFQKKMKDKKNSLKADSSAGYLNMDNSNASIGQSEYSKDELITDYARMFVYPGKRNSSTIALMLETTA